ncbi:hypothetical protein ACIRU8_42700 [Streptomyces sp. NPDC101175]|uniref:hypothetical protein n=1 Tax=Streptomyces sp. NPDC101175 TaxID=3366123 RepID=UPI003833A5F7
MQGMDYRSLLTKRSGALPLPHEVDQWANVADATGLEPYVAKASYVCGVMRELMQASGLSFERRYHIAALFLALDATELLGRLVTGARMAEDDPQYVSPSKALHRGARYLRDHGDSAVSLPHRPQDYVELRNFAGHGATYLRPNLNISPDSTRHLLWNLAYALNTMWDDKDLAANLASVEIHPLWTTNADGKPQPVYVSDIQEHLKTHEPAAQLDHNAWQTIVVRVDASSPPVTGR